MEELSGAQKNEGEISQLTSKMLKTKEWKEKNRGEKWYVGDTYNLSIGQGDLLVTPIQVASMTAVFANGGTLYRPQVVKAVIDPLNKNKEDVMPEIINNDFISKKNLQLVRLGMKDCVDYGSCRRLSLLPFSAAGKTGTAQWNKNKVEHAWFTSFAPYENPQIAITVMVEGGGEGNLTALPIAKLGLQNWFSRHPQ